MGGREGRKKGRMGNGRERAGEREAWREGGEKQEGKGVCVEG